jgi:hypothetical protein
MQKTVAFLYGNNNSRYPSERQLIPRINKKLKKLMTTEQNNAMDWRAK